MQLGYFITTLVDISSKTLVGVDEILVSLGEAVYLVLERGSELLGSLKFFGNCLDFFVKIIDLNLISWSANFTGCDNHSLGDF